MTTNIIIGNTFSGSTSIGAIGSERGPGGNIPRFGLFALMVAVLLFIVIKVTVNSHITIGSHNTTVIIAASHQSGVAP